MCPHLADIRSLIETPDWRFLRPNFPNSHDIFPGQLTPPQIVAVGEAVSELSQAGHVEPVEYSFGTLIPFRGPAEQKTSYRLQQRLASMIVHVLHFPVETPSIPSSRFLTQVHSTPTQDLFEYSDARSYFTLPWSSDTSIRFQEDGGVAIPTVGLAMLSRHRAARNITSAGIHLAGADLSHTRAEMAHQRHHLHKSGHILPLLIDVPVVSRQAPRQ